MKSFLEEYGFAILSAIVVILLISFATPIGGAIKGYCLDLVQSFSQTANKKIDMVEVEDTSVRVIYSDEVVKAIVTSSSTTDQFDYYVTYTSGGRLIENEKHEGDDSLNAEMMTRTFYPATDYQIDEGSSFTLTVEDLGTNVKTISNTINIGDVVTLNGIDPSLPYNTILDGHLYQKGVDLGEIAKGSIISWKGVAWQVMSINGNEVMVTSKNTLANIMWNGQTATATGSTSPSYAANACTAVSHNKATDNELTWKYWWIDGTNWVYYYRFDENNILWRAQVRYTNTTEAQRVSSYSGQIGAINAEWFACYPKDAGSTEYHYNNSTIDDWMNSYYTGTLGSDPAIVLSTISVGVNGNESKFGTVQRYVYAASQEEMSIFTQSERVTSGTSSYYWLRSADSGSVDCARRVDSGGSFYNNFVSNTNGIRPTFKLDVSKTGTITK